MKWLFDQVHVERSLNLNDTFCINKQENQGLIVGARTVYKHVITPHTAIIQLLNRGTASVGREENRITENDVGVEDYILQYLPKEIVDQLNDESLAVIHSANAAIHSDMKDRKQEDHDVDEATINLHAKSATITEDTDASIKDTDYEAALCSVISMGKNSEWETIELQEFKRLLSTAETAKKSFTVVELKAILSSCHATVSSGPKTVLVNKVFGVFGDKSTLSASPKSLKQIAEGHIKAWPKAVLNIVYATNTFKFKFKKCLLT